MTYSEVKHRIIRALPDDFLQDDGNKTALNMMEKAFEQLESQEDFFKKMYGKKTKTNKTRKKGDILCNIQNYLVLEN